jgi:hypothetical protein
MNTSEPRLPEKNDTPTLSALWATARDQLRARREARAARLRLERDLAAYTSAADVDDLFAVLDRYDDADTAEMRQILSRRRIHAA